jgi:hypothetical protein
MRPLCCLGACAVLGHYAQAARDPGPSGTDIGDRLGISKPADLGVDAAKI